MSQYPLLLTLPPVYSVDNFVVSDSNSDAFRWVEAWPRWPSHALLLHGPKGAGKSHLGHIWAQRAKAGIADARNIADIDLGKAGGRWLVEDIDLLSEERSLLHLFNASKEQQGYLLLTLSMPPEKLPFRLPDLMSRLLSLPRAEITEADDAALAASLRKQFTDRQMNVDEDVIAYLLPRMERSLGHVSHLVGLLDQQALAEKKAISIPLVKRVIEKLMPAD